jgi:hypothetical protein
MCPAFLWLSGAKRRRAKPHRGEDETFENDKSETEHDNINEERNSNTENG